EILVASVRHPIHIKDAGLIGADVVTVPPKTLMQLFNHPLTDSGISAFLKDAEQWKTAVTS
ncbi:fructose-6-phosphate aldolase, partial [bacterium]|nr:fructose-6-phosphate aldolase [bacterium]